MPKESRELMKQGESLPQICLDVHMSLCGSTEPLDTETMQRYGDVLRLARDHWEPPHPRLARFDSAVLQLILATISEMENATPTEL